jgi:zinc metalloprotease ZmpA
MKTSVRRGVLAFPIAMVLAISATLTGSAQSGAAAETPRQRAEAAARDFVSAHPARAGVTARQRLRLRDVLVDADGSAHVRFSRTFDGLVVIGGDFVVHLTRSLAVRGLTRASTARVALGSLAPIVRRAAAESTALAAAPTARRQVLRSRLVVDARAEPALAWDVVVGGVRADRTPSLLHVVVDARTAAVRLTWDAIQTETGVGNGFFNGTVALDTTPGGSGSSLVDPTRGNQSTLDKNNTSVFGGAGTLFTDADNIWGDGTLGNRQTVGVDAQYGAAETWDYFLSVHGRSGIRNNGVGATSRVHYGKRYNNAFWNDACFCMSYGDGDGVTYNPFASLDVAGHEMSHGITSNTAGLVYAGESGGLNEATSDIFGSMVEFFAANPAERPDYYIGERLFKGTRSALRAMHKPSLDGHSPDCYSAGVGSLDVHYSSGVANHFYYLLAEGSAANPPSPTCNASVVTGIGRAAAEKIWYRALTTYMVSTTNYAGARIATLKAARDLYGNPSTELLAVNSAWAAVSVG